mmetsp:Transcript_10527/g.31035  ORF Transcript_10527/g.31035 Transcript_10527/m.31035 type:complete len:276 (-) Transcript_10527:16-843(-)
MQRQPGAVRRDARRRAQAREPRGVRQIVHRPVARRRRAPVARGARRRRPAPGAPLPLRLRPPELRAHQPARKLVAEPRDARVPRARLPARLDARRAAVLHVPAPPHAPHRGHGGVPDPRVDGADRTADGRRPQCLSQARDAPDAPRCGFLEAAADPGGGDGVPDAPADAQVPGHIRHRARLGKPLRQLARGPPPQQLQHGARSGPDFLAGSRRRRLRGHASSDSSSKARRFGRRPAHPLDGGRPGGAAFSFRALRLAVELGAWLNVRAWSPLLVP